MSIRESCYEFIKITILLYGIIFCRLLVFLRFL